VCLFLEWQTDLRDVLLAGNSIRDMVAASGPWMIGCLHGGRRRSSVWRWLLLFLPPVEERAEEHDERQARIGDHLLRGRGSPENSCHLAPAPSTADGKAMAIRDTMEEQIQFNVGGFLNFNLNNLKTELLSYTILS
jgi:hypothetical protein